MKPFSIGQKVIIVRGSIDKTIYTIKSCSWRPDQTEPDPIPMKEHWKASEAAKKNGEKDFIPLPMPCPSYVLNNKTLWYHFELEAVEG